QASQVGTQLVGKVVGEVSDELGKNNVWGFKSGGYLRTALEAGGDAAIAAATGGNAGAAAASTLAGDIVAYQTRSWAGKVAASLVTDEATQKTLQNLLSNIIASGAGAAGGLVAGGGHNSSVNALNGAAAASA
ncbi:hypothetical protein, partial [Saccharibacter floricola]|uniref:hypothetical protein n=1 Tax=Saccharibacter floricola TaxID=231053 RepID=UPI00278C0764